MPTEATLFDGLPPEPEPEQDPERERVSSAIGQDVLRFCRARLGAEFHLEELREFVALRGHRAPDSAGRILRLLRQQGRLAYEVVNRRQSLYRIDEA